MKMNLVQFFIIYLCPVAFGQRTFLDSESNIKIYRAIKELAFAWIGTLNRKKIVLRKFFFLLSDIIRQDWRGG